MVVDWKQLYSQIHGSHILSNVLDSAHGIVCPGQYFYPYVPLHQVHRALGPFKSRKSLLLNGPALNTPEKLLHFKKKFIIIIIFTESSFRLWPLIFHFFYELWILGQTQGPPLFNLISFISFFPPRLTPNVQVTVFDINIWGQNVIFILKEAY